MDQAANHFLCPIRLLTASFSLHRQDKRILVRNESTLMEDGLSPCGRSELS